MAEFGAWQKMVMLYTALIIKMESFGPVITLMLAMASSYLMVLMATLQRQSFLTQLGVLGQDQRYQMPYCLPVQLTRAL